MGVGVYIVIAISLPGGGNAACPRNCCCCCPRRPRHRRYRRRRHHPRHCCPFHRPCCYPPKSSSSFSPLSSSKLIWSIHEPFRVVYAQTNQDVFLSLSIIPSKLRFPTRSPFREQVRSRRASSLAQFKLLSCRVHSINLLSPGFSWECCSNCHV